MRVGIAFDLRDESPAAAAEDRQEEYDSPATVDAIAAALEAIGCRPVRLGGGPDFVHRLADARVDLVFNTAEGWGGRSREAQTPAVCELLGVPYTHSEPLTLAISLDKAMTKRFAAYHGVKTPEFALVSRIEELSEMPLPPFPVIVKPAAEGSSMGIRRHSRCETPETLRERVAWVLREYGGAALIERFLTGPEITVLVLGEGERARVVGEMQIAPREGSPAEFIYSLEMKRNYRTLVEYHVPPCLPDAAIAAIRRVALAAYRSIGCRDIARVDLRLDEEGTPSLIEINPLPGLNPESGDVPILCGRIGLPYVDLIRAIVDEARRRI